MGEAMGGAPGCEKPQGDAQGLYEAGRGHKGVHEKGRGLQRPRGAEKGPHEAARGCKRASRGVKITSRGCNKSREDEKGPTMLKGA